MTREMNKDPISFSRASSWKACRFFLIMKKNFSVTTCSRLCTTATSLELRATSELFVVQLSSVSSTVFGTFHVYVRQQLK